jgi:hypothetical protein
MYDRTERMAEALSVAPRIVRLSQPVDTDRFAPLSGLHDPPRRALLMGNYVWGDRRELVARACAAVGIELVEAGYRHGRFERDPVRAMADADIVIGKARVIVEAMAAGRAAYVYDHNGGDGWVDRDRYQRLAADNFGGQVDPEPVDLDRLVRDLGAYSPEMGLVNRDLAVRNHSANKHAQQLVTLFRTLAPRSDPAAAPLDESARLVRRQWAAHGQLHALTVEAQDLRRQLEAAEAEKRALEERLTELQATRRYRLAAALARPLDLLRSR